MNEKTTFTASTSEPLSPITVYAIITVIIIVSASIIYSLITDLNSSQQDSNSFSDVEKKIATLEKHIFENKNLIQLLRKELAVLREQGETLLRPSNNMAPNATRNLVSNCIRGNGSITSTSENFEIKTITSNTGANIRVKPGLDQKIIRNLPKGTSVCIKKADDTLKKDSYIWVKIYTPNTGWVAKSLLST